MTAPTIKVDLVVRDLCKARFEALRTAVASTPPRVGEGWTGETEAWELGELRGR